jgi:hypothetical protein
MFLEQMHQFFVPVTPSTVFLASSKRAPSYADPRPPKTTTPKTPTTSSPPKPKPKSEPPASSLQPPLPRTFYTNPSPTFPSEDDKPSRYRVFGMTARILVDAARVAYACEPEYEHNSQFGDEEIMGKLLSIGRLSEKKVEGEVLTREVMREAVRAKV